MSAKRICTICGKEYEYCPRCEQYASMPRWYSSFCGENCKNIYDVTNKYIFNHITKEEAMNQLKDLDVSTINTGSTKDTINQIMYVAPKVIEDTVIETTIEEDKPKKIRRKNKIEEEIVNVD